MIRGIIYIIVFAAGFLAGGLFPSFSSQYHLRLQAQFEQVSIDLAPFQQIADRYHGGDMDALVKHHLASTDPTFHAEGEAIQLMIDSQARLAESKAAAEAPYHEQAWYLYKNLDENIARSTLDGFTPGLITTRDALTFSFAIAMLAIVALWIVWMLLTAPFRRKHPAG